MNTHNKNAYEVRLDVLTMAHNDLVGVFHQKVDILREQANQNNQPFNVKHFDENYPTPKEIIARAQELYRFVENK